MRLNNWRRMSRALSEDAMDEQRQALNEHINAEGTSGPELDPQCVRAALEQKHGQVWNSFELARDFEVEAFSAPLVIAIRRCDNVRGTLVFQHCPRFYWGFDPCE